MTLQNNILIVGAGPIGVITACVTKATNPAAGITIIEKRLEPSRNHGLKINADSINEIQKNLELALKQTNIPVNKEHINKLQQIFAYWSDNFIRTSEIEDVLAKLAVEMGIKVLKGPQYEVKPEQFDQYFKDQEEKEADINAELKQLFGDASLIIGADGSHSAIRHAVMKNVLADDQVLRHLIEFKFQSESSAQPRGYWETSSAFVKEGNLNFETMSSKAKGDNKPITVHIFVDKKTFDSFRIKDEHDKLKGVYGNSWTLAELYKLRNPRVRDVCSQFERYLDRLKGRGGSCKNEQISTLEMRVYRSEQCAQRHSSGKYVLLVGDAESGLVLERGFNKGLKGVAICAQIINSLKPENAEEQLGLYATQMQAIFQSEKSLAVIKNKALKVAETSLSFSHSLKKTSSISSLDLDSEEDEPVKSSSSCVLL